MCPWLNTLSLSSSDLNHDSPVLILSGQIDAISPPGLHANVHYNFTPQSTDKLIYEIAFTSHLVANGPEGGDGEVGWCVSCHENQQRRTILLGKPPCDLPKAAQQKSHRAKMRWQGLLGL